MRLLCFNQDDAVDFGAALRARYPDIRFRMLDYWDLQRRPAPGEAPRCDIPLFETLADASDWRFRVWIEPAGWQPVWGEPNHRNLRFVTNEPRLQFVFERGMLIPPTKNINLRTGRIWANYLADDREHRRFLDSVWRISAKLSTNVNDVVDPKTGKVNYPNQRTMMWAGHRALDWCRADPDRRLDGNLRPAD